MTKLQKVVSFMFLEKEPELEGVELVEAKCQEVLRSSRVGSPEFVAAYNQLEKVKALRMTETKVKKAPKIDPAIVGAGIGAGAQIVCTAMIEKYNAEGHLFPAKTVTVNWLGLGGLWSKVGGFLTGKKG